MPIFWVHLRRPAQSARTAILGDHGGALGQGLGTKHANQFPLHLPDTANPRDDLLSQIAALVEIDGPGVQSQFRGEFFPPYFPA